MSIKHKVIASYLSSGWAALMGIAFLPLYIRYLGIESFGLIGFFSALQIWLSLLDMGLSPTLNREMARFSAHMHNAQSIRDLLRSVETVYAGVAVLLALLVAALSPWIASDWLNPQNLDGKTVVYALVIMGCIISFQWMSTLYRSALLGLQQQVGLALITATAATLRALGAVFVLALVSPTIAAFLISQCTISVLEAGALAWYLRHHLPQSPRPPKFSLDALRSVWRFAAGLTTVALLATLLTQVDKILLAKLLPLDQYGYFALAVTVAGAMSLLIAPIHNVAYPRLTELASCKDEATLAQEYHQFAELLSIAVLPATLILCGFSREILVLWTQNAIIAESVAPIVSVWVIGTALNGLMHLPYAAQLAHGWTRLSVVANAIGVMLMIPAIMLLVPRYGGLGAAWIWVAITAGNLIIGVWVMHTRILKKQRLRWCAHDIGAPLIGGILSLLVIITVHRCMGNVSPLLDAIFLCAAGGLVTLSTALSTGLGRRLVFKFRGSIFPG